MEGPILVEVMPAAIEPTGPSIVASLGFAIESSLPAE